MKLSDLILETKIEKNVCKRVVEKINSSSFWREHTWQDSYGNKVYNQDDTDNLDILFLSEVAEEEEHYFYDLIVNCIREYEKKFDIIEDKIVTKFTRLRVNRYSKGQKMLKHFDHIRDLFTGNERGIPVLTIIINLNENYEGGNFIFDLFGEKINLQLEEGSVIIFPSMFAYKHGVSSILNGERYSIVSWAY